MTLLAEMARARRADARVIVSGGTRTRTRTGIRIRIRISLSRWSDDAPTCRPVREAEVMWRRS